MEGGQCLQDLCYIERLSACRFDKVLKVETATQCKSCHNRLGQHEIPRDSDELLMALTAFIVGKLLLGIKADWILESIGFLT